MEPTTLQPCPELSWNQDRGALGFLVFSWVSSLIPGVFPGHAPGQELEGSGDGGGVAVLISKLRRNSK